MKSRRGPRRSDCPISFTLEIIGDAWSLLILRDLVFGGKRHFKALMESKEGFATNILSARLRRLVKEGILTRERDSSDRKRWLYGLTEKGEDLLPIVVEMAIWGADNAPRSSLPPAILEKMRRDPKRLIEEMLAKLEP